MKRVVLIILSLLISMPLFAGLTITGSIPEEYRPELEKALVASLGGRWEGEVSVDSFEATEEGRLAFTLSFGGKAFSTVVDKKNLADEIDAMFFYEPLLYEEDCCLDYAYRSSFSSLSLGEGAKGSLWAARDKAGKLRGLFVREANYDEAALLRPLYLDSPKPGMKLEKVSPFVLRGDVWSSLDGTSFSEELSLLWSGITYPFVPYVSISFNQGLQEAMKIGAGLGFEMKFSFVSLWQNVPKFLSGTSVSADAQLDLYAGAEGVEMGGRWGVYMEIMPAGNLFLRAGVGEMGYGKLAVSVGGGGRIL